MRWTLGATARRRREARKSAREREFLFAFWR